MDRSCVLRRYRSSSEVANGWAWGIDVRMLPNSSTIGMMLLDTCPTTSGCSSVDHNSIKLGAASLFLYRCSSHVHKCNILELFYECSWSIGISYGGQVRKTKIPHPCSVQTPHYCVRVGWSGKWCLPQHPQHFHLCHPSCYRLEEIRIVELIFSLDRTESFFLLGGSWTSIQDVRRQSNF